MSELKKLEARRNIYAGRITETYRIAVKAQKDASYLTKFKVRHNDLREFYDEFQTYHNNIIQIIEEDSEFSAQDRVREEVDKIYYECKLIYSTLFDINPNSGTPVNPPAKVEASVKLPMLTIPTFNGDQKLWPTFFDLFKKLIHENSNLTNVEKLQYLFSYLEEEPLKLLSGISITNDNYSIAFKRLVDRYQNKRILASNALNAIMAISLKNNNAKELRSLLNTFSESLAALNALNFDTDHWDFILFHMLLEKLDIDTRTNFEIQYSNTEIPTYRNLYTFLENKCKALESVFHLTYNKTNKFNPKQSNNSNSAKYANKSPFSLCNSISADQSVPVTNIKCYYCKEHHVISKCPKFLAKSPVDRTTYAKQNKLCLNCLHHSHNSFNCNSTFRCRVCRQKHHSILHVQQTAHQSSSISTSSNSALQGNNNSSSSNSNISPSTISANTISFQSTVLLATAIVDILDGFGSFQPIRVLIDSGSQSSFISEKCLRRLNLSRNHFSTSIFGLNEMSSFSSKGLTHCVIKPQNLSGPTYSFEAIVVQKLCSNMPSFNLETHHWEHLKGLKLADEQFFISSPVDLLVGAEIFTQILGNGRVVGEAGQPTAIETIFGWVLLGKIDSSKDIPPINTFFTNFEVPLEISIPKFWEIEQIPSKSFMSPEDIKCEDIFQKTYSRTSSGRFIVPLPFKQSEPDLGDTFPQALRRFSMLENRLLKNPTLYSAYSEFMKDYIDSGHMSLIPSDLPPPVFSCYLPHHCVLKPESVSTKLRVVWDGSAKGPKGLSLNDTLLSGPKLQKDICSLLLIFRVHPVVFIADIKQMFRQVLVKSSHRDFQRILWRFSPEDPVSEWSLNTVTFGLTCSPYLAMRTINELADIERDRFPEASKLLKNNVYIDDILGCSPSISSALALQKELIELLSLGGFELRKWASNSSELLSTVPSSDLQMPLSFDKDEPHYLKVLGLQWHPLSDSFSYQCQASDRPCTKRTILSDIGRIFDPLGFLCPVLLTAKYIMQCLWTSKLEWDESPPSNIVSTWTKLKLELPELSKLSLPRRVILDNCQRCEIHGFCDASTIGYGAVIYFRIETSDNISIFLICAKGKVAPLKTLSLPKLELMAAKLLADLVSFVKDTFANQIVFDNIFAWSDSQVVLSWLNSSPSRWKTFVANRVSHIQEIVPSNLWHYVPSSLNAADCASRGLTPLELIMHKMWWNGPPFLYKPRSEWPSDIHSQLPASVVEMWKEEKRVVFNTIVEKHFFDLLLEKFSSLFRVQRILVYCLRFATNSKNPSHRLVGQPSFAELQRILMCLVKHVQYTVFSELISKINKNQLLPKPFRKLSLFLDSDGCLRTGGRLRKSNLPFSAKHPLLLPSSHRLTILIIEHTHKKYLHPGLKTLHNLILQQFWILSARKAIQTTLSKCIQCFKVRPKSYAPPSMGDLPSYRISQLKPFSHVAIDFCGPFFVTMYRSRGAKVFKSYICVFVCTATKAIHLELTQELSTDSFIAAFRRFIARRGNVVFCYSDNGTNFVGAQNQFLEYAKQASEKLSFRWSFSPPSGPHFNPPAEASVKMVKSHLFRVIGEQRLTYEEFTTLLCQIESVINSRPLCAQSSDPNDLVPLTPCHFLTLEPLNSVISESDLSHLNINRLSRWQLIQKLQSDFWKRYSLEYLNTLQQRLKWSNPVEEIKLNDLVLIKSDLKAPFKWPLGRVIALHPGEDKHTRVATVKTANGQFRRPVIKLCPLPIA